MKTTAYITVRLDIEYDEKEFSSAEEARQHAVQETPYSFPLNEKNIKITTSEDIEIFSALLQTTRPDWLH